MFQSQCKELLFEVRDDGVAIVTMNRPEMLNAFTWDMEVALRDAFLYCSSAEDIRAVLLTGAGKHFCAGGDIVSFKNRIESGKAMPSTGVGYLAQAARAIRFCSKPVVAMINGAAVGAGCAIALACDFRIGDERTKFKPGFTNMALSGDTNGVYLFAKLFGPARAVEFYMLGEEIKAEEAKKMGMLTKLAENGRLKEITEMFISELANGPTMAFGFQKAVINQSFYADMGSIQAMEQVFMPICSMSADHAEAVYAFLEKRQPKFIGK